MPGATWRPLAADYATKPRMSAHDIICIHTMVGSLWGTDAYFRQGGFTGTESHFGTGPDGEVLQWQDTDYQADANYQGSHHIISIENADVGAGFPTWNLNDGNAVPAFTDAQCEAVAKIIAWACREYDIPCVLIPDSKPGRRGIGYHRQGVPGYMVAGGELWSTAPGKVCPGNRRIAQIPQIIDRARAILGGATEEDDMNAEQDARLTRIENVLMRRANGGVQDIHNTTTTGLAELRALAKVVASNGDVDETALAAALVPQVIAALGEAKGITPADVEAAVSRVLARAAAS